MFLSKLSVVFIHHGSTQPVQSHRYVLEQILSGEPTEVVVENIHEYLNTVGENVRGGKIKLDDFIVHKVPSKNTPLASRLTSHNLAPR